MMKHFFSVKKEVELNECESCAGIWLDTGEQYRKGSASLHGG